MRKTGKRILSLLLAVLMLGSGMTAALAVPDTQTPEVRTQYGVDSTDTVGALLGDAITDSIPDEAAAYAVTDVTLDGKTATVSLNNSAACTVVVALYTEDRGLMLGSGVQKVAANTGTATVNIEITAMPEYFLLKAFLLGDNNEALCPNYTDIEHTKGFESFDSKTVDDFTEDVVINFDDAKDENFAVLVDGAVQTQDATHNVLQSYDEKTGKYVFTNIDDTVRTLSEGDIFKSETDDTVILLKVKSVSVDGTTATVYEEQEATYEDFFQFINVDESSYDTEEHATVNMDYADESVEFVGYNTWDDEQQASAQLEIDETGKLCPEFKGTKYLGGSSSSTLSVIFTYGFKVSAEYELKLFYDINWTWDFWNTTECLFCQMKLDFKIKGEIGLTGKFQIDLPLTELNFPTPIGIILTAKFDVYFEVTASVTLTIELFSFTIGFRYVEGNGFQNLCKAPQFKFEPKVEAKAEVKLAFKPIPCLSFIKAVAAEIQPEVGAKATLTLYTFDAMQALGYKMPDKLDTCTQPCFAGVASLYFSCKITGKFFGKSFGDFPLVAELSLKLGDFYVRFKPFSIHWGDVCPNMAYRVDFTIVNKAGKPIDNIDVESGAPDLGNAYSFNTKNATDKDGKVSFFYPKGTYTAKVLLDGSATAEKKIRMLKDTLSITIKVDTDETDGGGSGHHDYNGVAPGYSDGVGSDDTPLTGSFQQGEVIQFGSYPQEEVTDLITKEALNMILYDALQQDPNVWKSYRYYTGTGNWADGQMQPSDFMVYTDVYYNGGKYRAVKFSQYRPSNTCSISESTNQRGNGYQNTNYVYWFQYTPIRWVVLDPANGMLLCENILDAQAYNNYIIQKDAEYYSDDACTVRANDYVKSSLYHWLTNDFYSTAFSHAQQNCLLETRRPNTCFDSSYTQYNSTPTKDRVFLLSYAEVNDSENLFVKYPSSYAKCQGAPTRDTSNRGYCWTNSSNNDTYRAYSYSFRYYWGYYFYRETFGVTSIMGVCPAIRLDLGNHPSPAPKKTLSNISEKANTLLTAQSDESCTATADSTVVGSEYVLLVRKAGTTDLTPENLLYIDQQTAQTDSVTFDYTPRTAAGATVEIIGDFGSGIETRTAGEIEPPIVIVTVQVKTESGSTVTGAGEYYTGDTVTLTAQPRGKDRLDGWYVGGKCVGAGSTYTFTAEQDVTVRAVFTHPVIGGITVGDRTEKAKSAFTLSPNVQSNGTDYTLNFTSDNEKAATVDASGKVTTHKRGTATITVTATDEYGNTVSDACTVTVKYTFLQWLIIIFLFGWIWY